MEIPEDLLTFQHPCSNHKVAYWYCATHNFKNCRNALHNSKVKVNGEFDRSNKKRVFESEDDVLYGWGTIEGH